MSRIYVPSIKSGFGARLPTNMDKPGYWIASNKEGLEKIARYVSKSSSSSKSSSLVRARRARTA